eukprot:2424319-Rhodomonas_salina.1
MRRARKDLAASGMSRRGACCACTVSAACSRICSRMLRSASVSVCTRLVDRLERSSAPLLCALDQYRTHRIASGKWKRSPLSPPIANRRTFHCLCPSS